MDPAESKHSTAMTIRDTAAQDTVLASSPRTRRWRLPVVVALGVAVAAAATVSAWRGGSRSVDAARVRIAEVRRGDLVRDLSAEGRVISANSPTLYAISAGTVTLKVVAGDAVKRDQVLAEIDSPELRSRLAQEEATLAGLEAETSRATLDGALTRANARKQLDQASVDRIAAARDLERNKRAFDGGAVAQIGPALTHEGSVRGALFSADESRIHQAQITGIVFDHQNRNPPMS